MISDPMREHLIQIALGHMIASPSRESRYRWWSYARTLIRRRTPEQVKRMERERGLAW